MVTTPGGSTIRAPGQRGPLLEPTTHRVLASVSPLLGQDACPCPATLAHSVSPTSFLSWGWCLSLAARPDRSPGCASPTPPPRPGLPGGSEVGVSTHHACLNHSPGGLGSRHRPNSQGKRQGPERSRSWPRVTQPGSPELDLDLGIRPPHPWPPQPPSCGSSPKPTFLRRLLVLPAGLPARWPASPWACPGRRCPARSPHLSPTGTTPQPHTSSRNHLGRGQPAIGKMGGSQQLGVRRPPDWEALGTAGLGVPSPACLPLAQVPIANPSAVGRRRPQGEDTAGWEEGREHPHTIPGLSEAQRGQVTPPSHTTCSWAGRSISPPPQPPPPLLAPEGKAGSPTAGGRQGFHQP